MITQFRGCGDEIHVYPLSFSEYTSAYQETPDEAWDDYLVYGGLPLILTMEAPEDKAEYLNSLFQKVYISDIKYYFEDIGLRNFLLDENSLKL